MYRLKNITNRGNGAGETLDLGTGGLVRPGAERVFSAPTGRILQEMQRGTILVVDEANQQVTDFEGYHLEFQDRTSEVHMGTTHKQVTKRIPVAVYSEPDEEEPVADEVPPSDEKPPEEDAPPAEEETSSEEDSPSEEETSSEEPPAEEETPAEDTPDEEGASAEEDTSEEDPSAEGDTEETPVEGDTEETPVEGDTEETPVEGGDEPSFESDEAAFAAGFVPVEDGYARSSDLLASEAIEDIENTEGLNVEAFITGEERVTVLRAAGRDV